MKSLARAVAFGLGLMGGIAQAQVSYLECTAQRASSRTALVPDQVVLARDSATGRITVADSGAVQTGQPPAKGKIAQETPSRLRVQWSRRVAAEERGQLAPPIALTLDLNTRTNRAKLSARLVTKSRVQTRRARCAPLPAAQVAQIERLLRSPKLQREIKKSRADLSRYTCTLNKRNAGIPFLSRRFEFELPKHGRQAEVWDAFSQKHTGRRIEAKLDQERWPEIRVSWRLSELARSQYGSAASYFSSGTVELQATLNRKSDPFTLKVRLQSSQAPLQFRGRCTSAKS